MPERGRWNAGDSRDRARAGGLRGRGRVCGTSLAAVRLGEVPGPGCVAGCLSSGRVETLAVLAGLMRNLILGAARSPGCALSGRVGVDALVAGARYLDAGARGR